MATLFIFFFVVQARPLPLVPLKSLLVSIVICRCTKHVHIPT